jgi:hypothetical protein
VRPLIYDITPHDVGAPGGVEVLGGTITTNGTFGEGLTLADLDATFEIELTNGVETRTLTESNTNLDMSSGPLDVTAHAINLADELDKFLVIEASEAPLGQLVWSGPSEGDPAGFLFANVDGTGDFTFPMPEGIGSFAARPPGDANNDGLIDEEDLALVLANWGVGTTYATGDFNGDETVDGTDLNLLLGIAPDLASGVFQTSSVPEPSALVLALVGMLGLSCCRRSR